MDNSPEKELLLLNHLFFKKGIEKSKESIVFLNHALHITYINPNFKNYLGVSESFIEEQGGISYIYKNLDIEHLRQELDTKGIYEFSENIVSITGESKPFHVTFESFSKKNGQLSGIIVFHHPLSNEGTVKNLNESENRYRLVFDEAFQYIALLDLEGRLIEANKSAIRFGCLSINDFFNKYFWETHWWKSNPEQAQKVKDAISITLLGKSTSLIAQVQQTGHETPLEVETHFKPIFDKTGNVSYIIGEGIDITWHKQLKNQLFLSQQRFKAIFDSASQFLVLSEPNGQVADFNNTALMLCGIETKTKKPQALWELAIWKTHKENTQLISDSLSLCLTGKTIKRKIEVSPQSLPERSTEVLFKPIFDEEGKVFMVAVEIPEIQMFEGTGNYAIAENTSFRKQVETRFGIIYELSVHTQKGWAFNYISPHIESRYSISPMLFEGNMQKISFNSNAEAHEKFINGIEEAIEKQTQWIFESKIKTTSGQIKWLLWIGKPFRVSPEEVIFNGLILDITQKVLEEEKKQQSYQIYKLLIKNYPDGVLALINKEGKILLQEGKDEPIANEGNITGKDIEQFWEPVNEDSFKENIKKIFQQEIQSFEFKHKPSGHDYLVKGIPIDDQDGMLSMAVLVFQNISEQKSIIRQISDYNVNLERSLSGHRIRLKEIEKKFSLLFEHTASGILLTDQEDKIIQANPTFCKSIGYYEQEIKGKPISQFSTNPFPDVFHNIIQSGSDTISYQQYFTHKDQQSICYKVLAGIVYDENDNPIYALQLLEPIDKEKQIQTEQTETKLVKSMMAASIDPFMLLSFNGLIIESNKAFTEITKYESINAQSLYYYDLDIDHTEEEFFQIIQQLKNRPILSFETRIKRQDNKLIRARISMSVQSTEACTINCFISDLTYKEESLAAFKKSREFISSIVSNIQDLIFSLDPMREILFISEQCKEITGYSPIEFLENKKLLSDIIYISDKGLLDRKEENIRSGIPFQIEYRIITKSGKRKWVRESSKASWDEHGNLIRIDGSISDINTQKEAEERLKKSESALIEAQQMASIGNGEIDLVAQKIHWSKEMLQIHGLSDSNKSLNIQSIRSYTHPEDLINYDLALEKAISFRTIQYVSYRIIRPNGEIRHLKSIIKPVVQTGSRVEKIVNTVVDMTESEISRRKLSENEQLLKVITENISDMVCLHDTKGNITFASPSSYNVLGYTPEELIGQSSEFFIHQEDFLFKLKGLCKHFQPDETPPVIQLRIKNSKGEYVWMETLLKPLYKNGKTNGILSSSRDISERKNAQEKIERALEKERELGDLKSRFVSMASHEFRTPLSTIQSSVEILSMQSEGFGPDIQELFKKHVKRIKNEIGRMTDLMNDVLNMGRLEAGRVEFRPTETDVVKLIEELKENYFSNLPSERELEIEVSGIPVNLAADSKLLSHALKNLISNAFKYSENRPNPKVCIQFNDEEVQIQVIDYGIGIPEKEKESLFHSFYRASNTSNISGTGLGLVITRQFIELHNGTITFTSTENTGTTFRISLPLQYPPLP